MLGACTNSCPLGRQPRGSKLVDHQQQDVRARRQDGRGGKTDRIPAVLAAERHDDGQSQAEHDSHRGQHGEHARVGPLVLTARERGVDRA